MTRAAPPSVFAPYSQERALEGNTREVAYCGRCESRGVKTAVVFKADAIGRTYFRCPLCDRVAPPVRRHPDEVLRPQVLVPVGAYVLPPVAPGQLRCQRCARGVEGNDRVCKGCRRPGGPKAGTAAASAHTRIGNLPDDDPRKIAWRENLKKGKRKKATFAPRVCRWPGCNALFTPTGATSKYCGEHA